MRHLGIGVASAVLLLGLPAAHAQNKCVGENGRITYQQDPCPGAPRGSGKPAPAPAKRGPTSEELRAQLGELDRCAGDWEGIARNINSLGNQSAQERAKGRDTARADMANLQQIQALMARFMPICGKHGFQDLSDAAAAIQRNNAVAQDLRRKQEAMRAQIETVTAQEDERRKMAIAAQELARVRAQCARERKQLDDARATSSLYPPEQRAAREQAIAKVQQQLDRECDL